MDLRDLICYICDTYYPEDDLIHMQTNSLIIDSTYIDFASLINDLIGIKIDDDNLICNDCKDRLTQFYVMKQRVRSNHMNSAEIRKSQITNHVNSFLESSSVDFVVTKHKDLLAIHPDSVSQYFIEQLQLCQFLLEEDTYEDSPTEVDPPQLKNEDEIIYEEYIEQENYEVDIKPDPDKIQKAPESPVSNDWIKSETKQNMVVLETPYGHKTQWCCVKCPQCRSFSSEYAFRLHLKKCHFDEAESENRRQLNAVDHSFVEQKLWIQLQVQSRQKLAASNGGSWACSECDFTSTKRSRFRAHLQKAHTTILMRGPNKHSCFKCHLRFDGDNHLQVHNNCHKIFQVIAPHASFPTCESCRMFFINDDHLRTHLIRHEDYPEQLSDPIFANGIVHKNGEAFVAEEDETEIFDTDSPTCGHCLLKFRDENSCKIHLMLFHLAVFTCPFDAREFPGIPTFSFGNHLRQCHPTIFHEIEIACSFCKMQFDTVYDKLAHMKFCDAKAYQCDHCDKSFFRKAEVLHHLKVALGLMVFACHVCGKRCKDQGDLKTHIRIHTNDRPYPCPHCDKAYKTSSARASHVESHMEQTHICNICNVKFRRRILYQRHMKLLHDEAYRQKCFAENTCSICKKSYLRKTHFKNHMKSHKDSHLQT